MAMDQTSLCCSADLAGGPAAGDRRRSPARRRARAAHGVRPRLLRRLPARAGRQQRRAVHGDRERPVPDSSIDHMWLRVRDPQASRRFYTTVAPYAGLRLAHDAPDRVQLSGPTPRSRSCATSARSPNTCTPPSTRTRTSRCGSSTPQRSPRANEDHGTPGERAVNHPGYYGAFALDPDGHNVGSSNHNR